MTNIKKGKIEPGDCFAYQIKDDSEFKGRYIILCARELYDDNNIYYLLKITENDILPKNEKEINNLENIVATVTFMEDRFFPFSGLETVEETIKKKSKIKVYPDEMDYLYTYTIELDIPRKKINELLIYLGKYNIEIPSKEYIPIDSFDLPGVYYKFLETIFLRKYRAFNLKQSIIWSYTKEDREMQKHKKMEFIYAMDKIGDNYHD